MSVNGNQLETAIRSKIITTTPEPTEGGRQAGGFIVVALALHITNTTITFGRPAST
jgi:hypothetical protein